MTALPTVNVTSTSSTARPGSVPLTSVDEDETSMLRQMKPHVPGIVIFADHSRPLPWTVKYHAVVLFADVSGFTALCEKYSTTGQSGVDSLTRTLNEYLSALVDIILGSDGDILKFAGDAILAIWRVGRVEELQNEITKVIQCCLDIQNACGHWDTDIGVKLTVKLGVSAGEMSVTFLGNQEYRHYVELGPAVTEVNVAEHFCQSGMVVLSPGALRYCCEQRFDTEVLEDGKHLRILSILPSRRRSSSMPVSGLIEDFTTFMKSGNDRRLSTLSDDIPYDPFNKPLPKIGENQVAPAGKTPRSDTAPVTKSESSTETSMEPSSGQSQSTGESETSAVKEPAAPTAPKTFKSVGKSKMGAKLGKLRKVVETVTEMRLDIALRLYILPPVLKKFDDNQPLEYLSEMRQVVIVFMNLVLEDTQDDEEILQKTFEIVYSKSKAMHGCLNKVFLFDKGCTFLVIFGLPGYKHENDCAHALICSGRMKSQLDQLDGVKRVSIGITTGTTFCGVVGHPKRHEYSVIGRKVNMAARLMMHYPEKITCDDDTFQKCRLSPSYFVVLITKRMKGLRNVGVIREYTGTSKDEKRVAKGIAHSPFPMLGRAAEEFVFREQIVAMTDQDNETRKHLIFSGPSGIGKTKLLDQLISVANQKSLKVISCRVELEDNSYPYFVANHVIRALLSNGGYSHEIEKEPFIMESIGETDSKQMYLLNEVLGLELETPSSASEINEKSTRRQIMYKIAKACLEYDAGTVIIIDDAHNIDISSWELLTELITIHPILLTLAIRPTIIDTPPCREAMQLLESPDVKLVDLGTLELKYMAPLACQMMDVVSIPSDLDRLLRERSHGVPAWCREILRDMLDKQQLLVVQDDGGSQKCQSSVAPRRTLIKPLTTDIPANSENSTSAFVLHIPLSERPKESMENFLEPESSKQILSDLGFVPDTSSVSKAKAQMLASASQHLSTGGGALGVPSGVHNGERLLHVPGAVGSGSEERSKQNTAEVFDRIAIFATGIKAAEIPVPLSMQELIIGRIDSMRASDQLLIKCAAVLGKKVRRDILEMLLPKAHRSKLKGTIRRFMESGIFVCGNTPPFKQQAKIGKDEILTPKYRCYCHKDDVKPVKGLGGRTQPEIEACFEPMFTNDLLQQRAYDVLMEAQRTELHTKAAHYFELSADELRSSIPYYVLCRTPDENLQEKMQKLESEDQVLLQKLRRRGTSNKVEDEMWVQTATKSKARRGRRQAVSLNKDDAIPLLHRILQGAQPLLTLRYRVESLLPLYDNICVHWRSAGQPWNVLVTMVEAAVAALYIDRNSKAMELISKIKETLEELPTPSPERETEFRVIKAKVERLHAKVLFRSGDAQAAYDLLYRAAALVDMGGMRRTRHYSKLACTVKFTKFWYNLRFKMRQYMSTSVLTLEQGYFLIDLYNMDKELGDTQGKFVHAIQHFNKCLGQRMHLHQVMEAYSAVIECCRERGWLDTADSLEAELLELCFVRSDEMTTEDRCILADIYAKRSIHFFLIGQNAEAYIAGKTAAEICRCVHDMATTKILAPYYFYLCLARGDYRESLDLLEQLKFAAQISDDVVSKAMYHTICLEIALIGGSPPDPVSNCIIFVTKYLQWCDHSAGELMPRLLAAMTSAVWCARKERWKQTQIWFDYSDTYETAGDETSYFGLMARTKKVECMLLSLSKCGETNNVKVAAELEKAIKKDLLFLYGATKNIPSLEQRTLHLDCYFSAITGKSRKAESLLVKTLKSCEKHENKFEEAWIHQNYEDWTDNERLPDLNEKWQQRFEFHQLACETLGTCIVDNVYVLPLPNVPNASIAIRKCCN